MEQYLHKISKGHKKKHFETSQVDNDSLGKVSKTSFSH